MKRKNCFSIKSTIFSLVLGSGVIFSSFSHAEQSVDPEDPASHVRKNSTTVSFTPDGLQRKTTNRAQQEREDVEKDVVVTSRKTLVQKQHRPSILHEIESFLFKPRHPIFHGIETRLFKLYFDTGFKLSQKSTERVLTAAAKSKNTGLLKLILDPRYELPRPYHKTVEQVLADLHDEDILHTLFANNIIQQEEEESEMSVTNTLLCLIRHHNTHAMKILLDHGFKPHLTSFELVFREILKKKNSEALQLILDPRYQLPKPQPFDVERAMFTLEKSNDPHDKNILNILIADNKRNAQETERTITTMIYNLLLRDNTQDIKASLDRGLNPGQRGIDLLFPEILKRKNSEALQLILDPRYQLPKPSQRVIDEVFFLLSQENAVSKSKIQEEEALDVFELMGVDGEVFSFSEYENSNHDDIRRMLQKHGLEPSITLKTITDDLSQNQNSSEYSRI